MKIVIIYSLVFALIILGCQKKQEQQKNNNTNTVDINEKFCFLKDIENDEGKYYAAVDFIDYLKTSDLDSSTSENQKIELPNGYSYVNKETQIEKYEVADSAKIIMQTFSFSNNGNYNFNQIIQLKTLEEAIQKKGDKIFLHSPFRIKLENNKIVSLTEIYIP